MKRRAEVGYKTNTFESLRFRSSKNDNEAKENSRITTTSWLLIVLHSNLTCYFWIAYYIVDNVYGCTTAWHNYGGMAYPGDHNSTNLYMQDTYGINPRAAKVPVIGAISLGMP